MQSDIAAALRAQADALRAIADAMEAPATASSTRFYSRAALPPGVASWRAARETALREGIATSKPGREVLIDAAAWDAWAASKRAVRVIPAAGPEASAYGCVVQLRSVR